MERYRILVMRSVVCLREGIGSRVFLSIHRVRLCDGCGHHESRQSRMLQGSDCERIAGCRSGRGSARSRGRRSGVRRRNLTMANLEGAGDVVLRFLIERRSSELRGRCGRCPRSKEHGLLLLTRVCRRRGRGRRSRPSHCFLSNLFNECDCCQTPCLVGITLICQSIQFEPFPWSHVRLAVWDPAFGRLRA